MKKLGSVILSMFCFSFCSAQEAVVPVVREKLKKSIPRQSFHIYLMVGQSNMAGNVPTDAIDTIPNPKILRLNKSNEWEIAKEPLRIDKDIQGLSPGLSFAQHLVEQDTTLFIGLVPAAVGGTNIDLWVPGAFDAKTNLFPYDQALKRVKVAMQSGLLKGIIWHQGESNSNEADAKNYKNKLKDLILRFRKELGNNDLPFVAGLLPAYQTRKTIDGKFIVNPYVEVINLAIVELRDELRNYEIALLEGADHRAGDPAHLDAPSVRRAGKEYAEAMLKIN